MPRVTELDSLVSYHVSGSPRPGYGKTAPVQKGLLPIISSHPSDLCEEGVGFGVPILQYKRDFYFPGTSVVSNEGRVSGESVWKKFTMDLIDRRQGRFSKDIRMLSWAPQRIYNRVYKSNYGRRALQLIESKLESLRPDYDPSVFFRVKDRGVVLVSYLIDKTAGTIEVTMDFSGIRRSGLQHICISNELGGNLFDDYTDSSGVALRGDAIGAWDRINAAWATLYSPTMNLGFRMEIPESAQAFRGREIIGLDISWSGVIFMVSPTTISLQYRISVITKKENGE
jgi:hypothetical protein